MSSGGGSKQKPSPVEFAVATQLQNNLFPAAGEYFNKGTGGIYQGTRLGETSDVTAQTQQQALGLIPQFQQQTSAFLEGFQPLLSTDTSAIDARNEAITNNLIDSIGSRAGEQFSRNILPAIGSGASAAGQFGSSRQGVAEGVAAGDFANNLQRNISEVLERNVDRSALARESQLNRALQASSLYPTLQQSQLLPLQIGESVGQQLDQGNQLALEDYIQQFEGGRQAELRRLQEYQSLLGFSGPEQFSPQVTGAKPNDVQTALGAAALAGGIYNSVGN